MTSVAALVALFGLWLMLRDRRTAPARKPKLSPVHALGSTSAIANGGCSGAETCRVCVGALAVAVEKLPTNNFYQLPTADHDLIVWADGTYSLFPAIRPEVN